MKKHRALIVPALVLGLVLIAIAIVYWVEPAKSLPGFFPGHDAHSTTHHLKHGIAAFLARARRARLRLVPDGRREAEAATAP